MRGWVGHRAGPAVSENRKMSLPAGNGTTFPGTPSRLQALYQLRYSGSHLLQNLGGSFLVKWMMVKPVSKLTNMTDNIAVNYREKQREICNRMHSIISEFFWKCFVTTVTNFIVL
jgi:hypothetical protein